MGTGVGTGVGTGTGTGVGTTSAMTTAVQGKVRGCTGCWLRSQCVLPVPYHGPARPDIIVLGAAPSQGDVEDGRPFSRGAGRYVSMAARRAKARNIGYANIVSCSTGRKQSKVTADEVAACRGNLEVQLTAHGGAEPVILLAGAVALSVVRPDLKMSVDRGRPFVSTGGLIPEGWVVVPTWHPESVVRVPKLRDDFDVDLRQARWRSANDPFARWPEDCRDCGGDDRLVYDPGGVARCGDHAVGTYGAGRDILTWTLPMDFEEEAS